MSHSISHARNHVRRLHAMRILGSSGGCFVGIGLIAYLSVTSGVAFLIPSFGASSAILFIIPASAYAQPRSVVGGHLIASLVGLVFYYYLGTTWWTLSLAVGAAAVAMQVSRTLHPPAAADPLFFMMQGDLSWMSVLMPTLVGCLLLVLFAFVYYNWIVKKPYPQYWF